MKFEVRVPNMGVNDTEARLVEWFIKDGEQVKKGQPIALLETTKATLEIEADVDGYLFQEGQPDDRLAVSALLAFITDTPNRPEKAPAQNRAAIEGLMLTKKAEKLLEQMKIDPALLPKGVLLKESDLVKFSQGQMIATAPSAATQPSPRIPVMIYGTGTGGEIAAEVLELLKVYEVDCFIDDTPGKSGQLFMGRPIFAGGDLPQLAKRGVRYCVSLIADRNFRWKWLQRCEEAGITPLTVVHPNAWVSRSAKLGRGCFVKAGAVIETGVIVGDGCLVDNGVTLPHHVQLGKCVHLAPGAATGGQVIIGDRTLLGVGCAVTSKLTIGKDVIAFPGTVIDRTIEDGVILSGNPAKIQGANRNRM